MKADVSVAPSYGSVSLSNDPGSPSATVGVAVGVGVDFTAGVSVTVDCDENIPTPLHPANITSRTHDNSAARSPAIGLGVHDSV